MTRDDYLKAYWLYLTFVIKAILVSQALTIIAMFLLSGPKSGGWSQFPLFFFMTFLFSLIYAAVVFAVMASLGYGVWRASLRPKSPLWLATALQGFVASTALSLALSPLAMMTVQKPTWHEALLFSLWTLLKFALIAIPVAVLLGRRHYERP